MKQAVLYSVNPCCDNSELRRSIVLKACIKDSDMSYQYFPSIDVERIDKFQKKRDFFSPFQKLHPQVFLTHKKIFRNYCQKSWKVLLYWNAWFNWSFYCLLDVKIMLHELVTKGIFSIARYNKNERSLYRASIVYVLRGCFLFRRIVNSSLRVNPKFVVSPLLGNFLDPPLDWMHISENSLNFNCIKNDQV